MGYRDREVNFIAIDGTAVADGSDQEDNIDLSNYGVSMGNFMGLRIWKVELGTRPADDMIANTLDTFSISLRTITSGTTVPDFNDDGVVAQLKGSSTAITTSGAPTALQRIYGEVFPRGLLVVSDRLYIYFDNEVGISAAARARIWCTLEKMSESDWREAWEVWRRA